MPARQFAHKEGDYMAADASDSKILRFWYRLPLVVRSLVSGFAVFEVLQFG